MHIRSHRTAACCQANALHLYRFSARCLEYIPRFEQINLALSIEPPRGDLKQIIGVLAWVDAKTKPHQDPLYFCVAEIFAQNPLHLGTVKRDTPARHRPGDQVNRIALQFTSARVKNELGYAITRKYGRIEIRSSLETM